jgi:hypothetical protein
MIRRRRRLCGATGGVSSGVSVEVIADQ